MPKPNRLPEPMTEKEILEQQYRYAPKMVKVGALFGRPIWVDMGNEHEEVFHVISKFLHQAIKLPKEQNDGKKN